MRYPIYVPSKSRPHVRQTTRFLDAEQIPYFVVVEEIEFDEYAAVYPRERLVRMPGSNYGGVYAARNFIKDHSRANGDARHWQLDDNITNIRRYSNDQLYADGADAIFSAAEQFCDRYKNIAIAGFTHTAFRRGSRVPFAINRGVYSCVLVNNAPDARWRPDVVDDTDYSLQVLTAGWCTVLFYAFLMYKTNSGVLAGGNTDTTYAGDGRLRTARAMMRAWPSITKIVTRYGRPKVSTNHIWRHFAQQLEPVE
jgi:hypothetical protein